MGSVIILVEWTFLRSVFILAIILYEMHMPWAKEGCPFASFYFYTVMIDITESTISSLHVPY